MYINGLQFNTHCSYSTYLHTKLWIIPNSLHCLCNLLYTSTHTIEHSVILKHVSFEDVSTFSLLLLYFINNVQCFWNIMITYQKQCQIFDTWSSDCECLIMRTDIWMSYRNKGYLQCTNWFTSQLIVYIISQVTCWNDNMTFIWKSVNCESHLKELMSSIMPNLVSICPDSAIHFF